MNKDNPVVKVLINKYFLATVAIALILLFSKNNVVRWIKASGELSQQERLKEYYEREIESVEKEIEQLTHNRDSLEKFAREKYFYKEENEDVFVLR